MAKEEKKKEEKKKVKPSQNKMVQNILLKHPEVINNARHLFRNENGRTIVEDRVPRGDAERGSVGDPFCQGDLTDADLRDLAKYATEIVDEGILRYDEKTAYEDALHRAIGTKDGGKYAGKVGAVTYGLILSSMGKKKAAPVEKKANEISNIEEKTQSIDSSNDPKEDPMSNLGELAKIAEFIAKQGPDQMVILRAMVKEAADQNDPKRWQKTMDAIGIKAPKSKSASEEDETPGQEEAMSAKHDEDKPGHKDTKEEKKIEEKAMGKGHDEDEPGHEEKETAKEKAKEEKAVAEAEKKEDKDASSPLVDELDKIAEELEQSGDYELFKVAYQLDQVSDVLQGKKTATALESEPDEKYMKDAFNSRIRQKEKDEGYMESFATDKTQEVSKAYSKRPYGIVK